MQLTSGRMKAYTARVAGLLLLQQHLQRSCAFMMAPTMSADPLRVGIIGAGRIGQVHLATLASVPGVKPMILSDVIEEVRMESKSSHQPCELKLLSG
jgi:phosphoglycerate dehydrogenase-like enzyme